MRLTKSDKEAFVRAVIDDVPQIDYDELTRELVMKTLVSKLPQPVLTAYKHDPSWIKVTHITMPYPLRYVRGPTLDDSYSETTSRKLLGEEVFEQLVEYSEKKKEQEDRIDTLRAEVTGLINSCQTRKTALVKLPEFEKYLPADRESNGTANLPVANVVAGLVKAGWPKGERKAA